MLVINRLIGYTCSLIFEFTSHVQHYFHVTCSHFGAHLLLLRSNRFSCFINTFSILILEAMGCLVYLLNEHITEGEAKIIICMAPWPQLSLQCLESSLIIRCHIIKYNRPPWAICGAILRFRALELHYYLIIDYSKTDDVSFPFWHYDLAFRGNFGADMKILSCIDQFINWRVSLTNLEL